MKHLTLLVVLCALSLLPVRIAAQDQSQSEKPRIRTEADIPRFTYDVNQSASELFQSPDAMNELVKGLKKDLELLLNEYTIEDRGTLRKVHYSLASIAMVEDDGSAALMHFDRARALEDKPASREVIGLLSVSRINAERDVAANPGVSWRAALSRSLQERLSQLSWEIVQDEIERLKANLELYSENLVLGMIQGSMDPAVQKTGNLSADIAQQLVSLYSMTTHILPDQETYVEELRAHIGANKKEREKDDIWTARAVHLSPADVPVPVVVGIWDTGVDPAVYGEQMYVNFNETLNGLDDDGNGFVDDVHGIAYELWGGDPIPSILYPVSDEQQKELPSMLRDIKGLMDLQASIESPEAVQIRQKVASLSPAEVEPFMDGLGLMSVYVHGTHVAGIAMEGNPAARILVVRESFPYKMIPEPLTKESAERWAENLQRTVDYLRTHNVRVVNMSWGLGMKEVEQMFEMNGIGKDADERKVMAAEVFSVMQEGMTRAIAGAPEILFVPAAGNSDENVDFVFGIPASISLPNILTAGAVDQAGQETAFTSFGGRVRAHASGFEVESYVPGGARMKFSGTSMSAPNVTNLAAKLFALDPSLTPSEVVDLILRGADRSDDGRRVLINPKRSVALLQDR